MRCSYCFDSFSLREWVNANLSQFASARIANRGSSRKSWSVACLPEVTPSEAPMVKVRGEREIWQAPQWPRKLALVQRAQPKAIAVTNVAIMVCLLQGSAINGGKVSR